MTSSELPAEIAAAARELRSAFGPAVKLLRVMADDGRAWGNDKWDQLCQEIDNANP